ncbi:MAG: apolipoprotein N-acyltransferase [Candidatus Zhuqueibacterota bacterium]
MKKKLFCSLLTGVLLSFAFPPFRMGFLAYFALIPFLFVLEEVDYKESIRWGFLFGLFVNIGTLYWINWVTVPGAIGAILYLPVYFVIYSVLHTFIRKRLGNGQIYMWVPFLWTGMEYFRSLGVLGFPWNSLAYTQSYYLSLIQYVSYTSVYGVTFWVVLINVIILMLIKNIAGNYRRTIVYFIVLILLFILPWLYGKMVIPDDEAVPDEDIRVALIQGNIDPYLKWDDAFLQENLKIYDKLTRQSAALSPQLIIWPETAIPDYFRSSKLYLNGVKSLLADINVPLITGAPDYRFKENNEYITFNAVFLVRPNRSDLQIYHKIHLVPFGERVPFTERFQLLKAFLERFEMGEGNFSEGDEIVSFKVPLVPSDSLSQKEPGREFIMAPAVVCFESVFPELVRKFILNGSDILIVITNDAWFERSSAPYQHARMAVFRAIENRVSIARCANTGVSMFIDPYGRTLSATPIFEEKVLVDTIPLRTQTTFFTRFGNVFTIAVSLINLAPLLAALFNVRKHGKIAGSM